MEIADIAIRGVVIITVYVPKYDINLFLLLQRYANLSPLPNKYFLPQAFASQTANYKRIKTADRSAYD